MLESNSPPSPAHDPTSTSVSASASASAILRQALDALRLGPPQFCPRITLFPIFHPADHGPDYLSLDDAMATGRFRVTEISEAGSVPNLLVTNDTGRAVLILDGEELLGAKQNRVVNATFLLPPEFRSLIPVSCTEQGRWRHTTAQFSPSDVVLELKARRRKASSVSSSLSQCSTYQSDQSAVWDSIEALHAKAQHHSPTSAMHDVYQAQSRNLDDAMAAFPLQPGQHGLLVFLDGRPAGLDVVSRAAAYARLHRKLLRSYLLDALLDAHRPGPSTRAASAASPDLAVASLFLDRAGRGPVRLHPAVGLGQSLRAESSVPLGAALLHDHALIHAAFFGEGAIDPAWPDSSGLPSLRRRSQRSRPHDPPPNRSDLERE